MNVTDFRGWARAGSRQALVAAAFAAALTVSSGAQAQTLRAVMHSDLRVLDPIITTAYITRNHGYMIYDTLLALDENFEVRPQMADWEVSDDELTYTFTLRDGLTFHDGTPVTAEDVVASLQRWGKRDGMGQKLMDFTESLEATDEKTVTLKLKEPYGLVLESIGKPSSVVPFIMPKRIAETAPDTAITEHIGSGPFKFVQDEFQPGVRAVYEKNEDYAPREGEPSWASGAKEAKVDRVEWITMPDAQTAINALMSGEIDYIEQPPIDLLPLIEGNDEITVRNTNELGYQTIGRFNFLHPPFDDVKVRRAALLAMNQQDVMDAMIGNPDYYQLCGAMFVCGTPLETDVGSESLVQGNGMEEAKRLLQESGYDGTPIVVMHPTDVGTLKTQPVVAAQLLREAGFNVDLQAMDWQTLVTRRASQNPPAEGGWNMFFTNWVGADVFNPIVNAPLIATGTDGGWFGWPDDPELEKLRDEFARATTPEERKAAAEKVQERAYEQAIYIPLGQYVTPSAWSNNLSGVLDGPAPYFWNIEKSGS
jgi:peptide/nickel transport system substrate-binding protein